jgi:hypothetical protein
MLYCLICKEITQERYLLKVKDTRLDVGIKGHVCRHCFKKFIESHHNKGFFKIYKFLAWVKNKRDSARR